MSSVNANEIPDEQSFMTEYWNFRKKYYNGEEHDDFWKELVDAAEKISLKYKSLYVDMMLCTCLLDIEIRYKKKTGSRFLESDSKQLNNVFRFYKNLKNRYEAAK